MGGTKRLSKFIVDWENGTRVVYNNACRSSSRKCALTLHSCISVTDNIKISTEKINSDMQDPSTYTLTNWTILPEDVAVSNPMGNQVS